MYFFWQQITLICHLVLNWEYLCQQDGVWDPNKLQCVHGREGTAYPVQQCTSLGLFDRFWTKELYWIGIKYIMLVPLQNTARHCQCSKFHIIQGSWNVHLTSCSKDDFSRQLTNLDWVKKALQEGDEYIMRLLWNHDDLFLFNVTLFYCFLQCLVICPIILCQKSFQFQFQW